MGEPGLTPIDVLERAWKNPFTLQSNFAREVADLIAVLSYTGMITTKTDKGQYGNVWRCTPEGLKFLWKSKRIDK